MPQASFTNGYALLIGVNDNLIPNYALPTVAKDAAALHKVLIHPERCAYPADNVRLLTGPDASREGIYAGLSWLKERLAADRSDNATAVLFYSGHGVVNEDDNSYYFLPYDMRLPMLDSLLRADEVAAEIEMVRPRRMLVILDCCHAGGMGIKGDDPLVSEGISKAAAPAEARSVVALMQGQGRAVLSSSTAAESSYVRSDRKMSIFTYHLVEALTGHAQPEGATDVLVSDVMGYVSRAVPRSARDEYDVSQTPVYEMSGENFPVALLLGGQGISKGRPLPDPLKPLPAAGPVINTGGGGYVGGSVTAGGDVNLGAKTIGGDAIRGSKYVMSGDFRGAVLNIESHLSNVTQAIMAAPGGDAAARADLNSLVAGLQAEIEQLSGDHAAAAEALTARLERVTNALADSDAELADIGGAALERAADALGDARPGIPAIARQITAAVRGLMGR
ncbi:MAG: caspase family protein [Anaerolineales bacterium]|uniref:caspase family protein n=1 Tax=Promineifilum sp. TaxID=2664178 RepID=UPI001D288842|nr:caspase family protein [Anaerolineales bacterium]MCO5180179.1 caspase family protein [Promineifilum sp.]